MDGKIDGRVKTRQKALVCAEVILLRELSNNSYIDERSARYVIMGELLCSEQTAKSYVITLTSKPDKKIILKRGFLHKLASS